MGKAACKKWPPAERVSARGLWFAIISCLEEDVALVANVGFLHEFIGEVANVASNSLLQFLLFLLLSQGVMAFGMVAAIISGSAKGLEKEEMLGYALSSRITACSMILGYVLTIAIFLGRRYVKVKLGRIERDRLWPMAGMAALIALGWMFTEVGILQLFDADKLFADDLEELKELEKLMSGPLGAIAVGLLAPLAEEIGFRGVLLGGLIRMRCGAWPAIVISALVFAFFHGTQIQMLGTTVFGIIAGWLFWRTRSLIPGMIIHIVNNSSAVILEKICPDYEPSKLICVLMIVVFLPILLFGLKWFNRGGYQSRFL
jgi:membrane protease YdiL (CAAX protease family)